jgi:DNA-binding transcriptional LysR family regulator
LAQIQHPLRKADLSQHRAVSVADSARLLQARTVGLLFGQDTLSVPDMQTKYDFQRSGLGFGFLPEVGAVQALLQQGPHGRIRLMPQSENMADTQVGRPIAGA